MTGGPYRWSVQQGSDLADMFRLSTQPLPSQTERLSVDEPKSCCILHMSLLLGDLKMPLCRALVENTHQRLASLRDKKNEMREEKSRSGLDLPVEENLALMFQRKPRMGCQQAMKRRTNRLALA